MADSAKPSAVTVLLILLTYGILQVFAEIALSDLQVENKVQPLGIDVNPRFSWIVTSSQNGVVQTSYRIKVSKVQAGQSEIWDSGTVQSKQPYLIEYGGSQLQSDTRYFWSVDVASNSGAATSSSQFTTGFLSQSDWDPSVWIGKPTSTSGLDSVIAKFQSASWIWTSEASPPNAPAGDRAFRKTYASPSGKTASKATILMSVDDRFSLYVNGNLVGSSPNTTDIWKTAQVLTTPLNGTSNLFAVRATNLADVNNGGESPAGLIAAIQITFTDGSTDYITSDTTWKATSSIPSNFQSPTVSDSSWANAVAQAPYGQGPWGSSVVFPSTPTAVPDPTFTNANWIWSSETASPSAPAQPRAFRKTFTAPSGKTLQSAKIVVTVDDLFTLYVNGNNVGAAPDEVDIWKSGQKFTVPLSGTSVVFAVNGTNRPDVSTGGDSPAGLLASIVVVFTDGTYSSIASDTSWKVSKTIPSGFESPTFDDSSWSAATSLGKYGVDPWGTQVSISAPLEEHPAPLLRKEFSVSKTVSYARLYYSAGGYASITINGKPTSDRVLTPGFTNYNIQVQSVALDVASLLVNGQNAIGVELGRSHYGVTQGNVWNWNTAPWHGEPAFKAVLSIGYSDGTTAKVVTDDSWKAIEGPTRLDDVFGGENYDASYIQVGFDKAGFNANNWLAAAILSGPKGTLVNSRQPPTKVVQSLTPVSITQPTTGIYVVAFERVVAGWARISVTGPKKTLITIHYGEKLNPDGTVIYQDSQHYYANNFQTDRFWLAGTGSPETFEAKFSYKGYQYLQLEGWPSSSPPKASDIVGQVVHDDIAPRGGFTSSSDLLNKMHTAAVRTILNNAHSIPEDCPTYEKNGWSGDAMLGAEMFLSNLDGEDFLAKYVRDLDESRPGGNGPPGVIAPDDGWGSNNQAPTWHSAFIFIPWWLYQYRGDKRVLSDHYASMKSYIEFELGRSPNNIANTGLGDWVSPETSPLGGNAPEDPRISATAYLYKMLVTMNQVATVLGNTADASTFSSQAAAVKTAFNNAFYKSDVQYYAGTGDQGYRQTHNLLALAFGLADNSTVQAVADSIAKDVSTRGNHLNTGALGTKYILPVLTDHGHADAAFAVASQTTFPSWGFWIVNGANTMWEHWALEARSRDHLFLGTFEDWLFKHVAGIQASSTAFESVAIKPALTSYLNSASAWMRTPFGNLTVSWTVSNGQVQLNVGVPVSVNATMSVPTSGLKILSSNVKALNATGDSETMVELASGQHSFSFKA